jgi:nucleoside-diphosphate-sugar epimerase
MTYHQFAHPRIGAQVFDSRTARQKDAIEEPRGHSGQRRVGVNRDAAATSNMNVVGQRGDGDISARAAQQIDRRNGLNLLEAFRQDCENGGHEISSTRMNPDAHGKFSARHLVIVGCGYVGRAVAQLALSRGIHVTALTRNPQTAALLHADGIKVVIADLASATWHERMPAAPDYVVNCVSAGGGDLGSYRRSYEAGMTSLLTWARRDGGVDTLVYTSSTSVYPQSGGAIVGETAAISAVTDRSSVLISTEQLLENSAGAVRRWFILRAAGIYGPDRHHLLDQVRSGTVAGAGDARLNLVHRDDLVAAIWRCLEAPAERANDIFNVVDDAPAPKREVVSWLAGRAGLPLPVFSGVPTRGRSLSLDRVITNAKLKATLGWTPSYPTFREGYAPMLTP